MFRRPGRHIPPVDPRPARLLLRWSSPSTRAPRTGLAELRRVWVSFDKSDVRSLLAGEDVVTAFGPTNRSLRNLLGICGLLRP